MPLQTTLFVLACLISAAVFWRRLRPVVQAVLRSKPDADFRLQPLGRRVRRFVREVVLQEKVIRHRPWAGLAHALVFWGFCAFALVTLDHLAAGVGLSLFDPHEGGFGRAYGWVAAGFAVAVSAAITGLAVRRFVVRPKWLGEKVSLESGVIALLILVLMLTYLADFLWHPEAGSMEERALWWAHTLALLVFLPLIPKTKHLHLMLSPAAVFLAREPFGKVPPLEGEDDFGLVTGRDVTRRMALQAFSCVECGRCQEHCPAHNTGKELNPKQMALGLRAFLREHGGGADAPLAGPNLSLDAAFQCTTCGACEYQCPVGVEHLPLILGLRRGAVNTGAWEDEYGAQLFVRLERQGNPLGMAAYERDRFIQKNGLPWFDGSQEWCLWLGCMGTYDPRGREAVLALVRVLRASGVTFGVLRKEKCSGDAARRLGNDLLFQQLAEFNIAQLQSAGVKKILSVCPHCVRTIDVDWREFGAEFEVAHHSEWLAAHLPAGRAGGESTVFHDPCYLGRYRGVYEAPRRVAALAGELKEAPRSGERGFCCGAGGGLVFLGEERGTRVSHVRAQELAATGAKQVAVACPFCRTMLEDALSAAGGAGAPRVADVAEIAARALPAEE
ncbi:MAG: heterodisulfide reductase-related iron-sulfur binding cluster [Bryobacteraceae bacterium]